MTIGNESDAVSCSRPIDEAILADYWLGALASADEEAVEEHLLECDGCGARLREVIALAEGIRQIAREGSLRMIVSDEFLKRAAEEALGAGFVEGDEAGDHHARRHGFREIDRFLVDDAG
ncbi:MAG TPA: zf-HC2 domain-containing protein, partial [Candidatus Polarisedimenticolia bacterium]|nr:zf-HC2 domain-containing protein [Candidatus Polarisedimenticolia bacterium]